MSDGRDSERPHELNYAPPRRAEYPWWHDVVWALVVIVILMLLLSLFFPGH